MNIMFIGKMGSGKSFYANLLVKKFGFTRIALADPIKRIEEQLDATNTNADIFKIVAPYFESVPEYTFEHMDRMVIGLNEAKLIPRETPKPRKRLQYIGTEVGRVMVDKNIWIKFLKATIAKEPDKKWVIDDCRFKNEYDLLTSKFTPIKVLINREQQLKRLKADYPDFDPAVLDHPSEHDIEFMNPVLHISGILNVEEAEKHLEKIICIYS